MAYLYVHSVDYNSATLSIADLNPTSTYTDIYISCAGSTSSNLIRGGSGQTTSLSFTVNGLSSGTTYTATYSLRTAFGSTGSGSGSFTTLTYSYTIGGVGSVYVTNDYGGAVTVSWSYPASNAENHRVEIIDSSETVIDFQSVSASATSASFNGLSYGTTYTAKVYGRRSGSSNGTASTTTFMTEYRPPSYLTSLSLTAHATVAGRLDATWISANENATSYRWELYQGTSASGDYVQYGEISEKSVSITGLSDYTNYTIKVYGRKAGYANGNPSTATTRTKDLTPPVITSLTGDGNGKMSITYSATDYGIGLRDVDRYLCRISNENGGVYNSGFYTNSMTHSFDVDGEGKTFVNNSFYYMNVVAYDKEGNNSSSYILIQFKSARPFNWIWYTSKTSGGSINIGAEEWNEFCKRINEFRRYKNLQPTNFTVVFSGVTTINASIINSAIASISAMSPPISVPSSVSTGSIITAYAFNRLSESLNSIV